MKIKKFLIILLVALFTFSIAGCSNDEDNNPVEPQPKGPAKLQIKEVTVPQHLAQAQDPYAQMVNGFIQLANSFKNFTMFFTPPSGATHVPKSMGVNDEWTWNNGDITVRLVYEETGDMVHWKVYLTGTYEGFTATNWLGMEAEQTLDGSSGHLVVYEPVTSDIAVEWDWSANSDGSYTFEYTDMDSQNKISITVNADNSGTLKLYEDINNQSYMHYQITWTPAGNGHWWEYDTQGNIVAQGSWA